MSVEEDISIVSVHWPCHIHFYTRDKKAQGIIPAQGNIPASYCRQETADCFFITSQLSSDENCFRSLKRSWSLSFNQEWDFTAALCQSRLRGLDIFCSGGNLGRSLEKNDAVEFKWAVDYFKKAIHTYKANLKDLSNIRLFYKSVDILRQALEGQEEKLVAQAGEIDVISADSLCQGFFTANQRKGSSQSLSNVFMVASILSYVDFYRPQYEIPKNILDVVKCDVHDKEENVFVQVICGLVGMKYQVQSFCLDAWSFCSPWSRTILFISITAPDLTPLPDSPQTHAHSDDIPGHLLGQTVNELPLSSQYWDLTPFEYVTIGETMKDLLKMDGKTTCISFSDLRIGIFSRNHHHNLWLIDWLIHTLLWHRFKSDPWGTPRLCLLRLRQLPFPLPCLVRRYSRSRPGRSRCASFVDAERCSWTCDAAAWINHDCSSGIWQSSLYTKDRSRHWSPCVHRAWSAQRTITTSAAISRSRLS